MSPVGCFLMVETEADGYWTVTYGSSPCDLYVFESSSLCHFVVKFDVPNTGTTYISSNGSFGYDFHVFRSIGDSDGYGHYHRVSGYTY